MFEIERHHVNKLKEKSFFFNLNSNRYLAAKVYYFGVQGGIRQFEEYMTKTGLFESRVIRVIDASKLRIEENTL